MQKEKSLGMKLIVLVLSLVTGAVVGNVIMLGVLSLSDNPAMDIDSLSELLSDTANSNMVIALVGLNHLLLFVGGAILYWYFTSRRQLLRFFSIRFDMDWQLLGMLLLLLLASYPIIGAAGLLFDYIALPDWMQRLDDEYASTMTNMFIGGGVPKLLLNLIVVALLPALGEELIFRGIVQKELHANITNPHIVIFLTSLIFSVVHLQAEGFLPKLIISYVLCYSYYWTRNLLFPMILHFVNNATMTFALFLAEDIPTDKADIATIEFPWLGVAISLFLCAMITASILSRRKLPTDSVPKA